MKSKSLICFFGICSYYRPESGQLPKAYLLSGAGSESSAGKARIAEGRRALRRSCSGAEVLLTDRVFSDYMRTLGQNAVKVSYETGFVMTGVGEDGLNYSFVHGNEEERTGQMKLNIKGEEMAGLIHSHYRGLESIFSIDDLRALYQTYSAGHISDPEGYTFGVVTAEGASYLLLIKDTKAFERFGSKNLKKIRAFEDHSKYYNNWFLLYRRVYGKASAEARELAFLKAIEHSGLQLLKGDAGHQFWNPVLNIDNKIITPTCR